jgi:hypothetical protein
MVSRSNRGDDPLRLHGLDQDSERARVRNTDADTCESECQRPERNARRCARNTESGDHEHEAAMSSGLGRGEPAAAALTKTTIGHMQIPDPRQRQLVLEPTLSGEAFQGVVVSSVFGQRGAPFG